MIFILLFSLWCYVIVIAVFTSNNIIVFIKYSLINKINCVVLRLAAEIESTYFSKLTKINRQD